MSAKKRIEKNQEEQDVKEIKKEIPDATEETVKELSNNKGDD